MVKISIITVVFNDKEGLKKTIDSVLEQTYDNLEFVIIDGNSSDGTVDVIKKHAPQISYWLSEPDDGIYDAMNKGVKQASGDWLVFMNAGDTFFSKRSVEEMVNELDHSSVVYGNMIRTDGHRKQLTKGAHGKTLDAVDFMHSSISHQAAFVRKDVFKRHGLYSTKYKLASDAEFFFRTLVINHEPFKYINKTIAVFSLGGASTLHKSLYDEERKDFLKNSLGESVYERYEELYWYRYCKTATWLAHLKKYLRELKHKYVR